MSKETDNKNKAANKKSWLGYYSKIILETSIDGFCVVDTDGRFLEVNSAMCDMTGYSKAELVGKKITNIEINETPEQTVQHIKKAMKQGYERFETKHRCKDGKLIDVEVSTQFCDLGKDKFFFSFFRDITERKKSEQERKELLRDVCERAKELNCLYNISRLVEKSTSLNEILQGTVELIPPSWQYPKITYSRLTLNGEEFSTKNYKNTKWKQSCDIIVDNKKCGILEVGYLEERPEIDEGPFLKDERNLLEAIAERLGRTAEREKAVDDLKSTRKRLEYILATAPATTYASRVGGSWTATFISNNIKEQFGYEPIQFLENDFWVTHIHPDDRQRVLTQLAGLFENDFHIHEYRFLHKDGSYRWVHDELRLIRDREGKPIECIGYLTDITKRKQIEEDLILKNKAIDSSINAVAIANLDGKLSYINPKFLQMWGYSNASEVLGKPAENFWPEKEKAEKMLQILKGQDGLIAELTAQRKDGSLFDVQLSATVVKDNTGKPICLMGSFIDISEQKKAENALKESEEKFKNLVEATTDWVWEIDKNGVYVYASPKIRDLLGYSPEEVIGKTPFDLMPEAEAAKIKKLFEEKAAKKQIFYGLVNINYHKDGHLVSLETSGIPLFDEQGQLTGYRGIDRDITERRKAEEALRESEERYKALFHGAAEGILVADIETKEFKYANPAICKMLGYTEEEIKIMNVRNIHPKEILQHALAKFEAQARGERTLSPAIPCLRKDGTIIYADINSTNVMIDGRECNVGLFTDVTERKRIKGELENYKEKVIQAQKHAYVSSMGAIVAHQLNQPLTMINMLLGKVLQLKQTEDKDSPLIIKNIRESLTEVKKAASIIRKFRQHFKDPALHTGGIVNIRNTADRIVSILSEKAKQSKITIFLKNLENLPPVEINETALEQIFFIIIQNAIEAANDKKKHRLKITGEFSDGTINLKFADDCCGIPSENLDKIFEPFFSTKLNAMGMGLGLDIVQQILIGCGGQIYVKSRLGKGTTFYVTLPVGNAIKP